MKFETRFNKIKAMPDNRTKLLRLYNLAFGLIPQSPQQLEVKTEINKLLNAGISAI